MAALFATLGFTPGLALAPLRRDPTIETVHLFYGDPPKKKGETALQAARATVKTLGLRLVEHPVPDAFDYQEILASLSEAYEAVGDVDVRLNASGGTRVMVMAATIFAFTKELPLLYYDDYETRDGVVVPLRAFGGLGRLTTAQRAVVERLEAAGEADMGALASALDLSPSTLTGHVKSLRSLGLVHVARNGKRRLVSLIPEIGRSQLAAT